MAQQEEIRRNPSDLMWLNDADQTTSIPTKERDEH
jgi:hypothetical protein